MAIYAATFSGVAISAAQDVFEIVAPSNSRVRIAEIAIGQYSDAGDAVAEILSVQVIRGYTTTGSGGASVTPVNLSGHSGAASATSTVARNNTGVASGGSPATIRSDTWNIQTPWIYVPARVEQFILDAGQRLVVRVTAPADELTVNGTILFEELGYV